MNDALAGSPYEAPDVSDLPLHDLLILGESALGAAMTRLLADARNTQHCAAHFDSAL